MENNTTVAGDIRNLRHCLEGIEMSKEVEEIVQRCITSAACHNINLENRDYRPTLELGGTEVLLLVSPAEEEKFLGNLLIARTILEGLGFNIKVWKATCLDSTLKGLKKNQFIQYYVNVR